MSSGSYGLLATDKSTQSQEQEDKAALTSPLETLPNYIPHIFDLVQPLRDAIALTKSFIPPAFLESAAVDSSIFLGQGASFVASRQALPEGPKLSQSYWPGKGWTAKTIKPSAQSPRHVVYKTAGIRFKSNGEPQGDKDRRALESVLLEFYALIHPSILEHENIIDFLGLSWGSNPYSPDYKLPVLVVEYADHGSLAELQAKHQLDQQTKMQLCLEVGQGLKALHRSGIVHGDVKSENVLVFSHPQRRYVAKVADFGFSVIETVQTKQCRIGGTPYWRAPETKDEIPVHALKYTDVFSFGLLIWRIAIDGKNPFDLILSDHIEGSNAIQEIDRLKQEDKLLQKSRVGSWFQKLLFMGLEGWKTEKRCKKLVIDHEEDGQVKVQQSSNDKPNHTTNLMQPSRSESGGHSMDKDGAFGLNTMKILLRSDIQGKVDEIISRHIGASVLFSKLDRIFDKSLKKDFLTRDLDAIISILTIDVNASLRGSCLQSGSLEAPKGQQHLASESNVKETTTPPLIKSASQTSESNNRYIITNTSSETKYFHTIPIRKPPALIPMNNRVNATIEPVAGWVQRGFRNRSISWQKMRELDPTIQQFVFKSMPGITTDELFCLCAFYMNGYGVEEDGIKACEQLRKAATQGHYLSRGYLYRLHAACRIEVDSQVPLAEHLYQTAVLGSRMALQDLSVVAPEKVKKAQYSLRNTSGGVGANWYYRDQMLHSIEHVDIQLFKALADETKGISTLRVNRRGDSLLHLAANCGQVDGIEYLIENKQMDVNQVNEQGDTALLCACRAGQGPIAAPLLKKYGANASIAAHNGETPLHWLVSFRDADIPFVIDDLFSRGADINASTHLRVAHSVFPTGIDVDFQLPGTPLSWAVHNNRPIIVKALLARGANPLLQHQGGCLSPLAWAAYFHHSECLKLLVENLEERLAASDDEKRSDPRYAVEYRPLLFHAIKAADKFSMVLRNGVNYISNLHETLDIIHERTRLIGMARNFGGADQGPLYYAVAGAHDDVVRYMLQRGWLVDDLNSPCGNHQRTPVLEAVRWNRRSLYDLLVHHGADVTATARNPFNGSQGNWTALHIFAHAGYNEDVSLAETLIQAGVSVDGIPNADVETPLAIAIRNKAFRLADVLLAHDANINDVACKFGLLASSQPLTILGQAIASNMRYASTALTYLLSRCGPPAKPSQTDFIVDPVRGLSALHRCALAFEGLEIVTGAAVQKEEYDMNTNRDIIALLLGTFNKPEQIDFPRRLDGKTALHLAVEVGNAAAVELLLQRGACTTIASDAGETALDMARRLRGGAKEWDECLSILEGSDRDRIG